MKIKKKTALIILLCLCGCASLWGQSKVNYASKAKEQGFSYFFPRQTFDRTFATPEEAYDYIKTAQAKFSQTAGKPRNKGLAGKLIGTFPKPESAEKPVIVTCFLQATAPDKEIDLTKTSPMEETIRKAISAVDVYMVFYKDRGVVIPSFYLKEGYAYNTANMFKEVYYRNITYKPEYPFGWNTEKAFSYLRKEID